MLYIIVYNKNSILICEIKVSWLEKNWLFVVLSMQLRIFAFRKWGKMY